MTETHTKGQGQRSLGSEVRVETDGRTDRRTNAIALPPSLTRSVVSNVGIYWAKHLSGLS